MKIKKIIKNLAFEVPIFNELIFVIKNDKEKNLFNKCFKCSSDEYDLKKDENHQARVTYWKLPDDGTIFSVISFKPSATNRHNVVHESLHAALNILNRTGVETSVEQHEVLAYLQTFIYNEVCKKLKIKA